MGHYYFLPKALLTVAGAPDAAGFFAVSITPSLVPDRDHQYFIKWRPNGLSEDTITNLDVDSDGLLTSINYSAEDKTGTVVTDLVSSGINVFKAAGTLRSAAISEKRAPFKYTFDPLNGSETAQVTAELRRLHKIDLRIIPTRPLGSDKNIVVAGNRPALDDRGVFYHPPTTLEIRCRDLREPSLARAVVTIPDLGRIATFRLARSFLTKRETNLTFVRGVPTKLYFKQPSVVQGATGLLSNVTKVIGEAIPTLITVNDARETARLSSQQQVITAQSNLLVAQKKLLEDQKALDQLVAANPNTLPAARSDVLAATAGLQGQRQLITTLQEKIKYQKREIRQKLENSGLSPADLEKAIKAAGLDKEEEP